MKPDLSVAFCGFRMKNPIITASEPAAMGRNLRGFTIWEP